MDEQSGSAQARSGLLLLVACTVAFLVVAFIGDNAEGSKRGYSLVARGFALGGLYGLWTLVKGLWNIRRERRDEAVVQDLFASMNSNNAQWFKLGADLAEEIYESCLVAGQPIKLSAVESLCRERHGSWGSRVLHGWHQRMRERIDREEVEVITLDDDDVLFIHANHLASLDAPRGAP